MLAAPVHDQTQTGSIPALSVEPPSPREGLSDTNEVGTPRLLLPHAPAKAKPQGQRAGHKARTQAQS
ncbi:hypothetical protein GCM10010293_62420 [Streptomyces griseoflavus]|nr:hypothetical protein GCM10010293_62420 [Streptomyces griseoflavus]